MTTSSRTTRSGNRDQQGRHGGKRPGAGRPAGTGPYGEPTRPMRIPESLIVPIRELLERRMEAASAERDAVPVGDNILTPDFASESLHLPLFSDRVAAGFPSPADDHLENKLDLNEHLVKHPAATFFVRVEGQSMIGAGIHPDDILVVDRSMEASNGNIVVAAVDGELTVKRLQYRRARLFLEPENPDYDPIEITGETDLVVWGVVTSVIHQV
jgi:DNA polymerase V